MNAGLYRATAALDAAEFRHRIASENLAHVHQPGFRRRIVGQSTFSDELHRANAQTGQTAALGSNPSESEVYVDHSSGILEQSGRPLDVAIQVDGFFSVEGPDGPLYTRNGRFHVNQDGTLLTIDGLPVRGEGGNIITIPA